MWTGFFKGMAVTMRNMLRGPITLQYPEEKRVLPERARWALQHKRDENGAPKCTACLICEGACPDGIIRIEQHKTEDGGKHIDFYRYEVGACMFCGLCVEACPFDAIEMGKDYELATKDATCLDRILLQDVPAAGRKKPEPKPAEPNPAEPGAGTPAEPKPGSGAPAGETPSPTAAVEGGDA